MRARVFRRLSVGAQPTDTVAKLFAKANLVRKTTPRLSRSQHFPAPFHSPSRAFPQHPSVPRAEIFASIKAVRLLCLHQVPEPPRRNSVQTRIKALAKKAEEEDD